MATLDQHSQIAPAQAIVQDYFRDLANALELIDSERVARLTTRIISALAEGGSVYIAGNGGSAASASHMAADWNLNARAVHLPGRAQNLAESAALLTALANDCSYDEVFSLQLDRTPKEKTVLLVLSVGGSSSNLTRAVSRANDMGMCSLGLLGREGPVSRACDEYVVLGAADYGLAEDLHSAFNHLVVRAMHEGRPRRVTTAL